MKKIYFALTLGICLLAVMYGCSAKNGAGKTVALPDHSNMNGVTLEKAMTDRCSIRNFDLSKPITEQMLSDLVWSAWGVNRPDGKRTVPTAMNRQEMEVYVCREDGVWQYLPKEHKLQQITSEDMRVGQMQDAPVTLVYTGPEGRFTDMHAGSMYQNASLCAAAYGLGNVVLFTPVKELQEKLPMKPDHHVVIVQTFGWPANASGANTQSSE